VAIAKPFAVARYPVTRGEFAAFVNTTGHKMDGGAYVWNGKEWKTDPSKSWRDPGFSQDDRHPVVCVSWKDAQAYIEWLREKTGKVYRLPSEAEWEYAARAGTVTPFWWGKSITPDQANYDGNYVYKGGGSKGAYREKTVPVNSFEASPWGLYQVHGNVWEWCEDRWHDDYNGAPGWGLVDDR
jgi:formylglycine-generating enzyme required for sulfatase activity